MTIRFLTFSDIQTRDLLYYDPSLQELCYSFCSTRDIDCLPSLEDPKKIYVRNDADQSFNEESVESERVVSGSLNIFEPNVINLFTRHSLLLVMTDNTFTGMVHFSDYNKTIVSTHLYELFQDYEISLRKVLTKKKMKNSAMAEYFQVMLSSPEKSQDAKEKSIYTKKINDYNRNIEKLNNMPRFQGFYLLDLIGLINFHNIITLDVTVNKLRNMVMHAHEFISMKKPEDENLIYSLESFREFFSYSSILCKDQKRVKNYLSLNSE